MMQNLADGNQDQKIQFTRFDKKISLGVDTNFRVEKVIKNDKFLSRVKALKEHDSTTWYEFISINMK